MEQNQVVGDVIDAAPREYLQVFYDGVPVDMGNEVKPNSVKQAPRQLEWSANSNSLYTVCMVDPDAPSRGNPTASEWLHWLLINVPGNDLNSGETIMEYAGPTPPKGTGLHRYVFLVFEQRNTLQSNRVQSDVRGGRARFNTRRFTKKYSLGNAVAGNFFQSRC